MAGMGVTRGAISGADVCEGDKAAGHTLRQIFGELLWSRKT
jgi:hypothetical protein